jgi:tetratricopeptide (TPR) repeat protein
VVFVILGLCVALSLLTAALAYRNRADLKPHIAMALPLLFLLIAAIQIIPIPWGLRARIDPAGSELLALAQLKGSQPLTLDPPETHLELAKAAAALAVGLAALLLSAGRRFRFVSVGLVACAGLAALWVGLGHRAISEDKIYGLFGGSRGLLIGPFINPNHLSELLELAAFSALAFAFSRSSLYGQRVWRIGAAVLAAGALSTLSRGSVLALSAGALTLLVLAPRSDEGEPGHRSRSVTMLVGVVLVVGIALSFGADGLIDRFAQETGGGEPRFALWRDALKIVRAHPAGVGLGAFGRVYPVYQTLPTKTWFQFPENQPLGFLIEAGISGALLMLVAGGWAMHHIVRYARRDRVEASLAAGLVAVLAHNLTDFGLETMGVLLPFCATLGTMFGRQSIVPDNPSPRRSAMGFAATATMAALVATTLLLSPSARDFDEILHSRALGATPETARAASLAHPTDYLYALAEAKLAPTTPAFASRRLRMLNRAIILCPLCTEAHAEAARALWRLGRRQQALLEWRTVLGISGTQLGQTFAELVDGGATPADLMGLADDRNRFQVSQLLLSHGMLDAAKDVLAQASDQGGVDFQIAQTRVALARNDLVAAKTASDAALAAAHRDPRAVLAAADVALRLNEPSRAIELLQTGLAAHPMHVDLNRKLVGLLMQTDQWQAIDRALAGLRAALSTAGAPMAEAYLAAAQVFERRGQYHRAVTEYQAAVAQKPEDLGLRLALARAAEQSGRVSIAIDAYNVVLHHSPDNTEARNAVVRIQRDKKLLEVFGARPAHTRVNGP